MGEPLTTRINAGRWLLAGLLGMTAAAIALGRPIEIAYAAAVAVPLGGMALLLNGSRLTALIGEIISLNGFALLGAVIGGPLVALAVLIGMVGIAYLPAPRRRQPPHHRAALAGMIGSLVIAAQVFTAGVAPPSGGQEDAFSLALSFAWLLPAVALCAGWPQRRTLSAARARLGLARPTGTQALAAVGIAAGLVVVVNAVGLGVDWLFDLNGWAKTTDAEVRTTFAGLMTPLGVVVIAITAGIGEELFVRGLLQPRFGVVLPAVFFTALHAGQYRLNTMVPLLVLSLALGWVRARWHTTAAIIVHGTYDLLIGVLLLGGIT